MNAAAVQIHSSRLHWTRSPSTRTSKGFLIVGTRVEPSIITVTFHEANGITNVTTTIKYASKADRDAAFSTGMTDGMEMSYKVLDGVLGEI